MRKQQGFTLIELLVVIAIIGILATLVITQLGGATTKARNSSAQSDVTEAGKAIAVFTHDDASSGRVIAANTANGSLAGTGTAAPVSLVYNAAGTMTTIFSGSQVIDTSATASTYALSLTKTPSAAYTYKYWTGAGTAVKKLTTGFTPAYGFCTNTAAVQGGAAAAAFQVNTTGTSTTASC